MAWKMFSARCDAGALQLLDDDASESSHDFGALAERAVSNDGIFWIRMDVEHWRVIERNANRRHLCSQRAREPPGELSIVAPAKHGHGRPFRERRSQPRDTAAFLVDADPRRELDAQVSAIEGKTRYLLGTFDVPKPSKECYASQIEFPRQRSELDRHIRAREAADQQLSDAAAKRLRRHDLSL